MKGYKKPDYGNWVPKKLLALLYMTTLAITILLCLAVFCDWLMPITIIMAVLLCFSLFFLVLLMLHDGFPSCVLV